MTTSDLQVQIFQYIKSRIASHISLVDEVAAVLDISTDSAYRRIRGEKPLSLEEVYKLCNHYKFSLDRLLNLDSDNYLFTGSFVRPTTFQFDQYLKSVIQQIRYINGFNEKKLYTLCKDIPLFHHFHFKEIAAFKHYVWMRGIFNAPEFANKNFSLKDYPDEIFELGQKTMAIYNQIDCVEIWNIESINSTIRQIDFYRDSNLFEDESEVILIYEALEKLIIHLEKQADLGYKFKVGETNPTQSGTFQMYFNEMVIGDNSILAILDGTKTGFIIHTVINVMFTRDVRFCDNMYESMQNLMRRSTLISSVSERERSRFFKYLRNRIAARKQNLKV